MNVKPLHSSLPRFSGFHHVVFPRYERETDYQAHAQYEIEELQRCLPEDAPPKMAHWVLPQNGGLVVACLDELDETVHAFLEEGAMMACVAAHYQSGSRDAVIIHQMGYSSRHPFPIRNAAELEKAKLVIAHQNHARFPESYPKPIQPNPLWTLKERLRRVGMRIVAIPRQIKRLLPSH